MDAATVETEQTLQAREALKIYMRDFRRLQDIAFPILKANTQFCDKISADIGVYTLSERDLPKALRSRSGLPPVKSPAIIYVRGDSDIREGGVLLNENSKPASVNALDLDPDAQSQTIQVRYASGTEETSVTPEKICGYPVRLRFSPAINAYADGRNITVTTGMMDFANDEELALIIGHELAHNTHGHVRKIIQNTLLGFGTGIFARQFESEADYIGLYYAARAGYPIDNAKSFWRKLARISVRSLDKPKTHPITPERYIRLEAALSEIKAKQQAGLPLEPNLK